MLTTSIAKQPYERLLLSAAIFSAIIATIAAPTIRECFTTPTDNLQAISSGISSLIVLHTRG